LTDQIHRTTSQYIVTHVAQKKTMREYEYKESKIEFS